MNTISIKHSYNLGDAITILPGLQKIYMETGRKTIFMQRLDLPAYYYDEAVHPTKDKDGQQVCMNEAAFNMLKPLLEAQVYIHSVVVWQGEKVDIDFDQSRDRKAVPMPYGSIHHWPWFIAPELSCDLSVPWIYVELSEVLATMSDYVIINRTARYQNPYIHYFFLKKHEASLLFVGTVEEYHDFRGKWKLLNLNYLSVQDFYELAVILCSCKGFIGNQSFAWHVADAMKIPRVLEYCSVFPNTHPTGANGEAALYQEALELYVEKLFA